MVIEEPTTAASASQEQVRESTHDVTGSEENHAAERRRVVLKPCSSNNIDENKEKDETSKKGENDEQKEKDEAKKKAASDEDKKNNEAEAHTVEERDVQPPRKPTLEKIIGSFVIPFPVVKPSWDNREVAIWTCGYTGYGFRWPVRSDKDAKQLVASMQQHTLGNMWLPDMALDCSAFGCDNTTYSPHTGEHPDVIGTIVLHPEFDAWMKRFTVMFSRALAGDVVKVLLFCPRGTKRSVAIGRILAHALKHYGYKVVGPSNTDIDCTWHRINCGKCSDEQWLLDSTERLNLLNYAANQITKNLKNEAQMPPTPPRRSS